VLYLVTPIVAFAQNVDAPQANDPQKQVAVDSEPTPMEIAFGAFQRGFYLTALNKALPLAENGDANAQTLIAFIYDQGLGVPKRPKEAAAWYGFAANAGNREAQFSYAAMLMQGEAIEKNIEEATGFFKKAADKGHPQAQFNYAEIIAKKNSSHKAYAAALPYYIGAATSGIAEAQYVLALIYAEGLGVPQPDLTKAREWMGKAAVEGLTVAQLEFGIWLVNGTGGKAEPKIGAQWLLRAATKGNVVAQNRIAKLYFAGLGIEKNPVEGAKWHLLAKQQGKKDLELDEFYKNLSDDEKEQVQTAFDNLIASRGQLKNK
jgi:TPR repeat protein